VQTSVQKYNVIILVALILSRPLEAGEAKQILNITGGFEIHDRYISHEVCQFTASGIKYLSTEDSKVFYSY